MKYDIKIRKRIAIILCCFLFFSSNFAIGCGTDKNSGEPAACIISIDCRAVLDNMDDLKETKKEFIPNDGWILYLYIATVEDIRIFYCCLFLFDSYFYFFCNFSRFYRNCYFTFFLCFYHPIFRNGCDLLIRSGVGNLLLGSDWSNNWF